MNVLRNLSLLLALTAAVMLVSGTLGFTSTTADRNATVEAAGDDSAYVGYDTSRVEAFDGKEDVELVTVTNSLETTLNITDVTLESGDSVVDDNLDEPTGIDPGNASAIEGTISCDTDTTAHVTLTIEAEATDFSAEIDGDTRQFTVECDAERTVSGVEFNGQGNVHIDVTDTKDQVKGTVIYQQNGTLHSVTEWLNETGVRGQLDVKPNDFDIVAIAFPEDGRTYVHPGWNGNDIESSGSAKTAVTISQIVDDDWLEGYDATKKS